MGKCQHCEASSASKKRFRECGLSPVKASCIKCAKGRAELNTPKKTPGKKRIADKEADAIARAGAVVDAMRTKTGRSEGEAIGASITGVAATTATHVVQASASTVGDASAVQDAGDAVDASKVAMRTTCTWSYTTCRCRWSQQASCRREKWNGGCVSIL